MGFAVTLTGATTRKDGGIDIIGAKRDPALGNFLIAAQVKHHRVDNKTGRAAVDRLVSLKGGMFSFGLLVTNTYFTQDAKWVAAQAHNRHFAKLRDFQDMKNWLLENFAGERDYTELPDEIEIAPGIRIRVPRPDFSKLEFD
jgi:predicted Mrr-cat superfamily restriction endonuclease